MALSGTGDSKDHKALNRAAEQRAKILAKKELSISNRDAFMAREEKTTQYVPSFKLDINGDRLVEILAKLKDRSRETVVMGDDPIAPAVPLNKDMVKTL